MCSILNPLSRALRDVLQGYADGGTRQSIADELGRSANTVDSQVTAIKDELGADTITQAVAMAIRRGFIE